MSDPAEPVSVIILDKKYQFCLLYTSDAADDTQFV